VTIKLRMGRVSGYPKQEARSTPDAPFRPESLVNTPAATVARGRRPRPEFHRRFDIYLGARLFRTSKLLSVCVSDLISQADPIFTHPAQGLVREGAVSIAESRCATPHDRLPGRP
jgi:hypothetical protein